MDTYFTPLCVEHFHETVQMEGEMNLDFDLIESLTIEEIIEKANKHNEFWEKRYHNLIQEYSDLKGKLKPSIDEKRKDAKA